ASEAVAMLRVFPSDERRIVFLNGRYEPALSNTASDSVVMGNLQAALSHPEVEHHLARHAGHGKRAFAALNTAFFEDGALVYIPERASVARPVHIVHVSLPGARPAISHPRNLIVVGAGAHATVIESYIGGGAYFSNAVTEIVCGENSILEHCKMQQESIEAYHIASMQIRQDRSSVFTSRSLAFGGALARTEIGSVLDECCECTLNGLYLVSGHQHVDTRTTIDHAKPHASSHEMYKGILDGYSSAVFNGKIVVRKDAQKTDAKQTNKNLVLSENATINTKPQLEIFADDVRCTHGATVGQLDADSIFYLRSRGIDPGAARQILTYAFAREIVDGIKHEEFRDYVGAILSERLKEAR
ncbi:MAG: Fe-S cluster assembly protein SufD, partial [Bryobacteraceae bacterium]